jgi:hypothetical protein
MFEELSDPTTLIIIKVKSLHRRKTLTLIRFEPPALSGVCGYNTCVLTFLLGMCVVASSSNAQSPRLDEPRGLIAASTQPDSSFLPEAPVPSLPAEVSSSDSPTMTQESAVGSQHTARTVQTGHFDNLTTRKNSHLGLARLRKLEWGSKHLSHHLL